MKDLDFFIKKTFEMVSEYLSNSKSYEDTCINYYAEIEITPSMFKKTISCDEYFLVKIFDKENSIGLYCNKNDLLSLYEGMVAGGLHSFFKLYNSRKGFNSKEEYIEDVIEEIALDFLSEVNYEIENNSGIKLLLLNIN